MKQPHQRIKTIGTAVTSTEYHKIGLIASEQNMTVSEFVKKKIFEVPTPNLFSGGGNLAETEVRIDKLHQEILKYQKKITELEALNKGLSIHEKYYKQASEQLKIALDFIEELDDNFNNTLKDFGNISIAFQQKKENAIRDRIYNLQTKLHQWKKSNSKPLNLKIQK